MFGNTVLKQKDHFSPSFQKFASEVLRIAHNVSMVKSHQAFQAMGSLAGGEKSLKQYREPGGRLMESGCFPASRHRVALATVAAD